MTHGTHSQLSNRDYYRNHYYDHDHDHDHDW